MYSQTTHLIKISVIPEYQHDMSVPDNRVFVWSYTIHIENFSNTTVQLLNRYWRIIDATGHIEEVNGVGVVGQQPIIRPHEAFEYTSQCYLTTSSGIMTGSYQMVAQETRAIFDVDIPAFSLDTPYEQAVVN